MSKAWGLYALIACAGCGLPEGEYFGKINDDPDPTHLRYCNSGEPEYVDPALASSTTDMKPLYAMFDGLTNHDMNGLPEPSLATHWEISDDFTTFTFHLRADGKWTNGRPITAHDFAYGMMRVLHPLTLSKNAETLWKIKNGELYTANKVRLVLRDEPPFRAGDIVQVDGVVGMTPEQVEKDGLPDSNKRTAGGPLRLRDLEAEEKLAYATVPAGAEVTLIELGGPDRSWAYVHWDEEDGVYGWVPAAQLTGQPNGQVLYMVRDVDGPENYRKQGQLPGDALLMLPDVLGLRAIDDLTLVLQTWGPVPYLIDLTPQRAFRPTPREVVSRWPKKWTEPEHIVTSGAFHMTDWRIRDAIWLVKSPTWWNRDTVRLERVTLTSMNDQAANANYYYQGSCDAVVSNNIPSSYLPIVNGAKSGKARKDYLAAPYLGIYIYLVNTKRYPNVHFRRALSYSIDREPLPRILKGGQFPTAQFMPGTPISQLSDEDLALCGVTRDTKGVASVMISGELCYVPPPGLDYDLEKAKEEMAIAKREMGDQFPKVFTIKFNSGVEGHKLIAEWMQYQWRQTLGLDVRLESQEWKTFLKDTVNGEYDVARMGWIGNFPDVEAEFLPQFKCASPDNRTKFCDQEFEKQMKLAEATPDRKKRLEYAREAERIMVESAPILPLYVYTQHHLQKPYVRDLAINLVDQVPLHKAWIDPDWREHGLTGIGVDGSPSKRAGETQAKR